ncbi:uncharacterized protein PF3D7_1120600-like isoform X2 [Mytilus trossulus]
MGKHNPVNTVEKCDEWLCTRTKKKIDTPSVTGRRACLSKPLRSIGNLIKSSPPPEELKTHTKQSKLINFFGKKIPDTLNNESWNIVQLSESSEELPTLSGTRKIDNTSNQTRCSFHTDKKGDNFTLKSQESEEHCVNEKGSQFCKEGDDELPPLKSPYYNKRRRSSDSCLPNKHPKYDSEISYVNKNQLKDTTEDCDQSDSSPLEQFSCNSNHCDSQNQNNSFQLRNPIRKNNIVASSSSLERNEKHNFGGNVILKDRIHKLFDNFPVVTQTSNIKPRTCDIHQLHFMSKTSLKRSGIQTSDHLLNNDLDLTSEVEPPIKPTVSDLSDIPNTELDFLSEVQTPKERTSVSHHKSDIPNTELDFLSEVQTPKERTSVSHHKSDIPNTELDFLSEVQTPKERTSVAHHKSDIPNTELDFLSEVQTPKERTSVPHHKSDIPNTELDFLSEVQAPIERTSVSHYKSDIPNTELDFLSETQHCRELPFSSSDLNSDFMTDTDSSIKHSETLEQIQYEWNMGSFKDHQRKLINTQDADKELENFSLDNDSQIVL